jgi:D-alanyl-D-alanine carboxypeptidase/D-alanyl-D-alanine-endopeptidase (penicillin-binding protein 4)
VSAHRHRPRTPARLVPGLWLALVAVAWAGPGHTGALPVEIEKALRLQQIDQADLSLYVREVGQDRPRVDFNGQVPRAPASTIKLLTSIAALGQLGPNFRWQTRAWLGGPLTNGRLAGDLIIQGGGDPSLRLEDLWRLLWELRARGLTTIGGDLVIDNSAFAPPDTTRAAFDGKGQSGYNALPMAFSVNEQLTQVELRLDPGAKTLRAYLAPPVAHLELRNELKVVQGACQSKNHRVHVAVDPAAPSTLTLTGTFATACERDSIEGLLLDPVQQAGNAVLSLWEGLGGTLEGQLREGVRPKNAVLFNVHESPELPVVLRDINKWSNNLIARTLFLTIGMERYGRPATPAKGQAAVKEWLGKQGLDFPELVVENGSGLSREDRIGAASMGRLLAWAYANPGMSELMASLPILGVDGTLHRRFKHDALRGHGHLKTGTMAGATGLAGFVDDRSGRRWIMVSLINNPRLQTWRGKAVEEAVLRWLYGEPAAGEGGRKAAAGTTPGARERRP